VHFTKHPGNPVLEWSPNGDGEEGAASGAALVDLDGSVLLYYGANSFAGRNSVNADARLAVSSDGTDLIDTAKVLDHDSAGIWGSGDELFPVAALRHAERYIVFYMPNGSPERRTLGVAWGNQRARLTQTGGARVAARDVSLLGPASVVQLSRDRWAIFINHVHEDRFEAYTFSPDSPRRLEGPVVSYHFPNVWAGTVLLDRDTSTWFLYYRTPGGHGVKLAPMGPPDESGPSAPLELTAIDADSSSVELTWQPADDPDTGVAHYVVYRDGERVGTSRVTSFRDEGLSELSGYVYQVSAVNYHGAHGQLGTPLDVTTARDRSGPRIESASASGDLSRLVLEFDEAVTPESAEVLEHYRLEAGAEVVAAELLSEKSVALTTTELTDGVTYWVEIEGVEDRSQRGNPSSAQQIAVTASQAPGLVGWWRFEEGDGETVGDSANFGSDGSTAYPGRAPATWVRGRIGGGLRFDGRDDLVTIRSGRRLANATSHSFTIAAWIKPTAWPENQNPSNTHHSIVTRGSGGLFYEASGEWRSSIELETGELVDLRSQPTSPGDWHHAAMVVDAVARELRLFIDGREVDESPRSYSGSPRDLGESPFYLGTQDPLIERWDNRFTGVLDDVRIHDRALDSAEVARAYSAATDAVATESGHRSRAER